MRTDNSAATQGPTKQVGDEAIIAGHEDDPEQPAICPLLGSEQHVAQHMLARAQPLRVVDHQHSRAADARTEGARRLLKRA
jgi:hypothetical protein